MRCCFPLLIAVTLLMVGSVSSLSATEQQKPRCKGHNNTIPVLTAAPTLVKTVTNGKMYVAGEGNDTFTILHLWGTPYEQGVAQGQLRQDVLQNAWPKLDNWIKGQIEGKLGKELPQWLIDLIAIFGAPFLLQETFKNTKPFTPQRYLDEMQGIADGAGIDVEIIQNINMFPELTKAACTIVGANHNATPGHQIQHLRGLDFSPHCPLKDDAQVTVYHDNDGLAVANFGWTAMVGALTGISNTSIGIGEKVWLDHKHVSGVHGEPWMFILRDVLRAKNIDEALSTIQNANRTCAIHVGIGDSTTNKFRGVKMAKDAFLVYNWSSIDYPQHPILPGIMYWDKHEQPTGSYCLSDLLKEYYGKITADVLALAIAPVSETGNMQSAAFDYEAQIAYIANAKKTWDTEGRLEAFARQYTKLNLTALWMEPSP